VAGASEPDVCHLLPTVSPFCTGTACGHQASVDILEVGEPWPITVCFGLLSTWLFLLYPIEAMTSPTSPLHGRGHQEALASPGRLQLCPCPTPWSYSHVLRGGGRGNLILLSPARVLVPNLCFSSPFWLKKKKTNPKQVKEYMLAFPGRKATQLTSSITVETSKPWSCLEGPPDSHLLFQDCPQTALLQSCL
jgi:hypothetical protein